MMTPTVTMSPGLFMLLIVVVILTSGAVAYVICGELLKWRWREFIHYYKRSQDDVVSLTFENRNLKRRIAELEDKLEQANDGEQWRNE